MYRQARTEAEQNQVTAALMTQIDGWKTGDDAFSRLLRSSLDFDDNEPFAENDDPLPPSLEAAIARAKVDVSRR
jgi:hypothetical protein